MRALTTVFAAAAATTLVAVPALAATTTPPTIGPGYNRAAGAMKQLVAHHGWAARDAGMLGRRATRRELARGLAELMTARGMQPPSTFALPSDISATDPDVQAISWVSTLRLLGTPGGAFNPTGTVTGRVADVSVVDVLGLNTEVRALNTLHTANGLRLKVPAAFGQEVLAEQLGLRHNYPAQFDNLEANVSQPIAVADVAGMTSAAINLSPWQLSVMNRYSTIELPNETANQRTMIQAALAEVGMPYIWGGVVPNPQTLFGARVAGGFDCSGLVWWAFKLNPLSASDGLGNNIRGRTADNMAWEAPKQKVALNKLKPGRHPVLWIQRHPHAARWYLARVDLPRRRMDRPVGRIAWRSRCDLRLRLVAVGNDLRTARPDDGRRIDRRRIVDHLDAVDTDHPDDPVPSSSEPRPGILRQRCRPGPQACLTRTSPRLGTSDPGYRRQVRVRTASTTSSTVNWTRYRRALPLAATPRCASIKALESPSADISAAHA